MQSCACVGARAYDRCRGVRREGAWIATRCRWEWKQPAQIGRPGRAGRCADMSLGPWEIDKSLTRGCQESAKCVANVVKAVSDCLNRTSCTTHEQFLLMQENKDWARSSAFCVNDMCFCNSYVWHGGSSCTEITQDSYLNMLPYIVVALHSLAVACWGAYPLVVLKYHGVLPIRASEVTCLLAIFGLLSSSALCFGWFFFHFVFVLPSFGTRYVICTLGITGSLSVGALVRLALTWAHLANHTHAVRAMDTQVLSVFAYIILFIYVGGLFIIAVSPETQLIFVAALNIVIGWIAVFSLLYGCSRTTFLFRDTNPDYRRWSTCKLLFYALFLPKFLNSVSSQSPSPARTSRLGSSSLSSFLGTITVRQRGTNSDRQGPYVTGTRRGNLNSSPKNPRPLASQVEQTRTSELFPRDSDFSTQDFEEVQGGQRILVRRILAASTRVFVCVTLFTVAHVPYIYSLMNLRYTEELALRPLFRFSVVLMGIAHTEAMRSVLWFFRRSYEARVALVSKSSTSPNAPEEDSANSIVSNETGSPQLRLGSSYTEKVVELPSL